MAVGAPFQKSKRPFSGGDDLIDEAADHIIVGLNLGGAGDAIFPAAMASAIASLIAPCNAAYQCS